MSKIDLSKLSQPTPREWVKVLPAASNKSKKDLDYITARVCMYILDDAVGLENWSCEYKEIKGLLMCGVSIRVDGEWITKWSNGTEANFEEDKSIVSNSFKCACVLWGIGRDLYKEGPYQNKTGVERDATPSRQPTDSSESPGSPQSNSPYIVSFGKHSGKPITDIPVEYIQWYLKQGDKKDPNLVKVFTDEFNRRVAHVNV